MKIFKIILSGTLLLSFFIAPLRAKAETQETTTETQETTTETADKSYEDMVADISKYVSDQTNAIFENQIVLAIISAISGLVAAWGLMAPIVFRIKKTIEKLKNQSSGFDDTTNNVAELQSEVKDLTNAIQEMSKYYTDNTAQYEVIKDAILNTEKITKIGLMSKIENVKDGTAEAIGKVGEDEEGR